MAKKYNLILSGGGVRGLAHIGVLKELEKNNITIQKIIGTSSGALVAALYASCLDIQKVATFTKSLSFYTLPDLSFSTQGLLAGERLMNKISTFLDVTTFEELNIPIIITAVNIRTGKEKTFSKGPLLPALRASIAYPGVLTPKKIDGQHYLDGGLASPLPVHLVKNKQPIIISDVATNIAITEKPSMVGLLKQSVNILQQNLIKQELENTKNKFVHIKPDVKEWDVFSIKNDPEIIVRGEAATKKQLQKILSL